MSNFDLAFDIVLGLEGGFVDHSADPGGATNYGISLRYLKQRGDLDGDGVLDGDLDRDGDIDIDDIRGINPANAKHFYQSGFWSPNKLQQVQDQDLAVKIFDMCVNMGGRQAWRLVQRACNGLGEELIEDGLVGPMTLEVVNEFDDPVMLLAEIREQQRQFYERLVEQKPDLAVFLDGWTNRAMA